MTSSAMAISLVVVFFTVPSNRAPSTLTSSTCTSADGASLKSLPIFGSSFAVISAAVGSLMGLASGGCRKLLKVIPMPANNTRQGMPIRLQDMSFWPRVRLVR
jgi:hypothetical protein